MLEAVITSEKLTSLMVKKKLNYIFSCKYIPSLIEIKETKDIFIHKVIKQSFKQIYGEVKIIEEFNRKKRSLLKLLIPIML